MSGITLRHQVKPSVLQIHHYHDPAGAVIDAGRQEPSELQVTSSATRWTCNPSWSNEASFNNDVRNSCRSIMSYSRLTIHPSLKKRSASTVSLKSTESAFFCDWSPHLFGVDEDSIPPSEESSEEELFGEGSVREETEGPQVRKPKYGRRARPKPELRRQTGENFECICDIDTTFQRHYIPHFGGGIKTDNDWRTPHFTSFWEDFNERWAAREDADLLKMVDIQSGDEKKEAETVKTETELERGKRRGFLYTGPYPKQSRKNVLERLRTLSCRELRRYRMAFSEAIVLEMEEDGYLEAAAFLKSLLVRERQLDQSRDPCPTLRRSRTIILKVMKLLMAAERRGRKQEYNMQSIVLLKTGRYFSFGEATWWWLAEKMFEKAVEVSSLCVIDGGKSEATARYIYGMFLLDQAGKVNAAQEQLTRARELSQGRDWNAKMILENASEPIHKECCNHLCRALIETSRQLRKEGKPEEALQFIHQSYKLCEEAQISRDDIMLETLFELGMTYQDAGEVEWAKAAFKKYVAKAKMVKCPRSVCDGHLELAICYRMEGDPNRCHHHLNSYLETATQNSDPLLTAFGNRYLGELLLNHGQSVEAADYLNKAFAGFLELYNQALEKPYEKWLREDFALSDDVELVRILQGLASGENIAKYVCSLIVQSWDLKKQSGGAKLLQWKNSNIIDKTECSAASATSSPGDLLGGEKMSAQIIGAESFVTTAADLNESEHSFR